MKSFVLKSLMAVSLFFASDFVMLAQMSSVGRSQIHAQQMRDVNRAHRKEMRDQNRPDNYYFPWRMNKEYVPMEEVVTEVMPDGHVVEYHHVYNGPVVWDSVPYERKYNVHLVPFFGLNGSRLTGEKIATSPFQPGFNAGLRVDWYKDDCRSFYISSGLNYTQMNLQYKGDDFSRFSVDSKLQAFHIPFYFGPQFHLNDNMKLGLGIGGKFGAYICAESKDRVGDYYNGCKDFDGVVGLEAWLAYKHLNIGIQYDWGFASMTYGDRQYAFMQFESYTRQTLALNIGYRLWDK